jgi:hypothetical protein
VETEIEDRGGSLQQKKKELRGLVVLANGWSVRKSFRTLDDAFKLSLGAENAKLSN